MKTTNISTKLVSIAVGIYLISLLASVMPILTLSIFSIFALFVIGQLIFKRIRMAEPASWARSFEETLRKTPWWAYVLLLIVGALLVVQVVGYVGPTVYEIFAPDEQVNFIDKMTIREQSFITGADKQIVDIELLDKDLKTIGSDKLTSPNYVAIFEELDVPGGYLWLRVYATGVYWLPEQTDELLSHPNGTGLITDEVGDVTYYRLDVPSSTFTLDMYIAQKLAIDISNAENQTGITNSTYSLFTTNFQMNLTTAEALLRGANLTITADDTCWNATQVNIFSSIIDFEIQDDDGDDVWETDETLVAVLGDILNEEETQTTEWGLITWEGIGTNCTQNISVSLEYFDEDGDAQVMDSINILLSNYS